MKWLQKLGSMLGMGKKAKAGKAKAKKRRR